MSHRATSLVLAVFAVLLLAACGGGGAAVSGNQGPSVVVTAPAADVEVGVTHGGTILIAYRDDDPDDTAHTDLVADRDGDPATTNDQVPIASGRPDGDGVQQTVSWDLAGVPPGAYTVLAKTSDGRSATSAAAGGRVLLNAASALRITQPATDITVSRGGLVSVAYEDSDPDDVALTWISADRDGDPATVDPGDATTAPLTEGDGATQRLSLRLGAAAVGGRFSILGTTWDGTNTPATSEAPGRVDVRNVAWARSLGAAGSYNKAFAVGALADGSSVLAGEFEDTLVFGAGEPNETTLTASGRDIFIARYDPDGRLQWAKRAGGAGGDSAFALATFADGSFAVTGSYSNAATFGPGEGAETVLSESTGFYVARYAATGALVWARTAAGNGTAYGKGIATRSDGSIVVTGSARDNVVFGPGQGNETSLTSTQDSVFLARYDANGTLDWAAQAKGDGFCYGNDVAIFADGSCAVAGDVGGFAEVTFGAGEAGEVQVMPDIRDPFVARWNADGTFAWIAQTQDDVFGTGDGVATLPDGSCIATGTAQGAAVFGAGEAAETRFGDATGAFVARYLPDGTLAWARRAEAAVPGALSTSAGGKQVVMRRDGAVLVLGHFSGLVTFGAGDAAETTLASQAAPGRRDTFAALFEADGRLVWVRNLNGSTETWGLAVHSDGSFFLAGLFVDTIVPGLGDPHETTLTAVGDGDAFLARFNADGGF